MTVGEPGERRKLGHSACVEKPGSKPRLISESSYSESVYQSSVHTNHTSVRDLLLPRAPFIAKFLLYCEHLTSYSYLHFLALSSTLGHH